MLLQKDADGLWTVWYQKVMHFPKTHDIAQAIAYAYETQRNYQTNQ